MKSPLPLILLAFTLSAAAQSKISPAGRLILEQYHLDVTNGLDTDSDPLKPLSTRTSSETVGALVSLAQGFSANDLTDRGFEVTSDLGSIALLNVPLDRIEELAALDEVVSVSFGETVKASMDLARPASNVTPVQDGFSYNGATVSFDGTGIVVGMMDNGLDANHINFKNHTGRSRIQRLFHMTGDDGTFRTYNPMTISAFRTDNESSGHATHVAGIMGGGYKGPGTYITMSSPTGGSMPNVVRDGGNVPYYGVATQGDLVLACGSLTHANIIQGVTNIIEYAEQQGQPAVVNLSLGSTYGPHDGTDNYTRALSELGKRGIICMAAGNDGDVNMSLSRTFTASNSSLKTAIENNTASGIVDIWGSDSNPMTVTWGVYNTATATLSEIIKVTNAGETFTTAGNSDFSNYFNGSITVTSNVDPNNNRFNVFSNLSVTPKSSASNRYIVLIIDGASGQTCNVYSYSSTKAITFVRNNLTGYSAGSPANSINCGACGENILSVGSYTTRNVWPVLGANDAGSAYQFSGSFPVDGISPFSSYGTAFNGTKLPLVCAPGAGIIASISSYTVSNPADASARVTSGNRTDYWGEMQGTSMACPYVTGTVALWLQACPTLDYEGVMEVINNTSTYSPLLMRPKDRWGAGTINAQKGIEYILTNHAAIGSVWEDDEARFLVTPNGAGYDVTLAGEAQFEVKVVDLQGRAVASARGADGSASVETSTLTPGIYIITVNAPSATLSRKIQVR